MKKIGLGILILMVSLLVAAGARAYTWTYNTTFDFALAGFSDTSQTPPVPTNGPLTLTISNITGLSLPDPAAGTYEWSLEIDNFMLDFIPNVTGDELSGSNLGPFDIGTWQAPLAAQGSFNLGDVYVPEFTINYMNNSYTVGNYTVQNAVFSWELTNNGTLVNPGDSIDEIVLTLTADNLNTTINRDLTALDNLAGGANGVIDGTGIADFKVSAVPEPATVMLLGAGLLLAGIARKRFSK
ncbi:PEP-CTERM sorting domain-containing protein [Thermodesulfatator atlanticus]|uniref:PEP-CTERM sorting domain-containing protein n=1 Tax=Thermodesulfatator atlanticus TaxID=501497 RepID=UPI0003B5D226|nr:PEP-CTERM sorting domain-containing protein [Thermodesulfatator atlanticus]